MLKIVHPAPATTPPPVAQVLDFPRDARRQFTHAEVLRRARMLARAEGCNHNQVRMVEGHAQGLLDGGQDGYAAIRGARDYAKSLHR